jgi:hypothetical protein
MGATRPVLLLLVSACAPAAPAPALSSAPAPTPAPAAPSASAPAPATSAAPASADAWPASLGVPPLPAPGPVAITGYPTQLTQCLPDPADHAGFTTDTDEFGYCAHGMGWKCEFVDAEGRRRVESSAASANSPDEDPHKARWLEGWMKTHLPALAVDKCKVTPRPLAGTWAYPDIALRAVTVPASFAGNRLVSQPLVRLGGSVDGAPAVFPVTRSAPHTAMSAPGSGEIPYNVAELNDLALSADGKELGWVVHSFCGEWCDDFRVERVAAAHLAALVYNDTGFAAYRAGDLAKAKTLFLRAAYIDPTAELAAYNLACVLARTGDPRVEDALKLAVARGGAGVKERARKDADFDGVRTAEWFARVTGGR